MMIYKILFIISLFVPYVSPAAGFLPTDKLFISKFEAKQSELKTAQEQLEALKNDIEKNEAKQSGLLDSIKQDINKTKSDLAAAVDNEFYSQRLVHLNDRYQVLKDYRQARERLVVTYQELIQLLTEYVQDPEFDRYKQELAPDRIAFSFEDLRQIKEKIDAKKVLIDLLIQNELTTQSEIKGREQAAAALVHRYIEKKEEQEKTEKNEIDSFDLSVQQKRELTNLEFALLGSKKELDDLQLQILHVRTKLLRAKIEQERQQLRVLQEIFVRIRQSSIRISDADVAFARDELEKKRQKLNAEKIDMYEPKKEEIKKQIAADRQELLLLSKQYNVPVTDDFNEWIIPPKQTVDGLKGFLLVAKANEQMLVDKLRLDELDAEIELLDQSLFLERVETEIKSSFYKMFAGKFASEEKIFEDIKRYEARLSDIKADVSQLEGKKAAIELRLTMTKKALDNLAQKRQETIDHMDRLFKNKPQDYTEMLEILNVSEALVKQEVKRLNGIRGIYNDTALKLIKIEQQIKFTIEELRASLRSIIWDRPEDAISWQGVKNIVSDLETFMYDVYSYLSHFELSPLVYKIKGLFKGQYNFVYFLLSLFAWFMLTVLLWFILPKMRDFLYRMAKGRKFARQSAFCAVLLDSIVQYFGMIFLWLTLFLYFKYYVIPDPYPYIIFYLCSIPFLLYITYRFVNFFIIKNAELGYVFIGKEYVNRFMSCLSTLLYATVVIFFFRESFILANYAKSELPNILKALNIIILQISVIFMLTKELVLSFIPRSNDMWQWMRDKVDHYYYFILMALITVIVMMNPYVGFGRLVLFILSNVIYTLLLIGVLFWLHGLVKRWSSSFFFYSEQEVVKERFPSAKTWYGVSIIAILLTFIFVGAIAAAKIWQWPEKLNTIKELHDIVQWLKTPLLLSHTESPISVYSVLQFLFFVLAGFLAAVGIRRFVLSRIFDVLLIDSGVQNTVNSLMRYIVMLIAILLGLNAVGLGTQINVMLGALLVGIGFIIKDPAADFFAYFVILVQRPIKIGDYIKIDEEVMGVVRKITPRSVVLRRRNSTMIVIPNSYVTNRPIINWNYIRGFIAFNDITVVISYKDDPIKAKEIFERVLDTSPYVLKNPKPVIRLEHFGVNGYEFILRGYISSNYTLDQWNIASDIRLQLVKILREHKMHLALPIRLMVNYAEHERTHVNMNEPITEDLSD
jgi:small-conductance mechanosensitive channel